MDSAAGRRGDGSAGSGRAWRRGLAVAGAVLLAIGVPLTVSAAGPPHHVATAPVEPGGSDNSDTDTTSTPPTSPVDTTAPSSEPTTLPTPESTSASAGESVVGAGETGEGVNTAAFVVGLVGLVALVGVAAWWMVRRDDEDDRPHPHEPPPVSDLI